MAPLYESVEWEIVPHTYVCDAKLDVFMNAGAALANMMAFAAWMDPVQTPRPISQVYNDVGQAQYGLAHGRFSGGTINSKGQFVMNIDGRTAIFDAKNGLVNHDEFFAEEKAAP